MIHLVKHNMETRRLIASTADKLPGHSPIFDRWDDHYFESVRLNLLTEETSMQYDTKNRMLISLFIHGQWRIYIVKF